MSPLAPTITLANGARMPRLGLGTWPLDDDAAEEAVAAAIGSGYRLIDTAFAYGNEVGVGRGLAAGGVPRKELFVTTKFNQEDHSVDGAERAFERSAQRLGVDHIDLLMIHWPNPSHGRYVEAYRGLVKLLEDGRISAIGLSNFKPEHVDRVLEATGVTPDVDQIELDPTKSRPATRAYLAEKGIAVEAWSPLGGSSDDLRHDPTIVAIAEAHGRTASQVVLRWHMQTVDVTVPKSADPGRQRENLEIFDFELTADELRRIRELDRGDEGVTDSDSFGH
jgi:2,5-diketo-D-gluconate reductase A